MENFEKIENKIASIDNKVRCLHRAQKVLRKQEIRGNLFLNQLTKKGIEGVTEYIDNLGFILAKEAYELELLVIKQQEKEEGE